MEERTVKRVAIVLALAALMGAGGCAAPSAFNAAKNSEVAPDRFRLVLDSVPSAAQIVDRQSGRIYGETPIVLEFSYSEQMRGIPRIGSSLAVRWRSGAQFNIDTVPNSNYRYFKHVFFRPANFPNEATDIAYQNEVEARANRQAEANRQSEYDATAAFLLGIVGAMTSARSSSPLPEPQGALVTNPTRDQFCEGFEAGYRAEKGAGAMVPGCPTPPIPRIGSSPYSEGIRAGTSAARR